MAIPRTGAKSGMNIPKNRDPARKRGETRHRRAA